MPRVLVTGGCGFIGSHIVDRLLELGYDVVVLDNLLQDSKIQPKTTNEIEFILGDVRDQDTVLKATKGCKYVIHLAAYLGVDIVADNPVEAMEVESIGTHNVTHAVLANAVEKLVYASTSGVYGKTAISKAVDEDFTPSPSSSYAIAKRFNEIYLQGLFQEKAMESISLRYFNVYGARQDARMVIPRFLKQAMRGEPITVYGTGEQTRDFTYIDDTVEATINVMENVSGCHIVNVANGMDQSIFSVAEKLVELTKSTSEVRLVEPPPGRYDFEVMRRSGNSEKLQKLTGARPDIGLDEGLRRMLDSLANLEIDSVA